MVVALVTQGHRPTPTAAAGGALRLALLLCILADLFTHTRINAKVIFVSGSLDSACLMSDGVSGTCREVKECLTLNGTIRRNGTIHRCDIQGIQSPDIYVCCRQPAQITKTLCSAWSKFWSCTDETPLVIGGVEADKGDFKHIAAVGKIVNKDGRKRTYIWQCGGSLITPHFVLTAAHCVTAGKIKYAVRLGEHDTRLENKSPTERLIGDIPETLLKAQEINQSTSSPVNIEQTIEVVQVILHPKYRRIPKYHDIALLQLKQPAVFTRFVLPACLPSENHVPPLKGDILHAAGWGRTVANLRESSHTLQKVDLPVITNRKCSLQFRKEGYKKDLPLGITKDMLCAGEPGKDTCKGDSGGPLVRQLSMNNVSCSQHELVGLVSFGRGCGKLGVYTRVSKYLDWITDYIAPNMN